MNVFQFRTQKSWSRVWVEYGSSVVWARFELECSQSDLVKALFFEGGHLTPPSCDLMNFRSLLHMPSRCKFFTKTESVADPLGPWYTMALVHLFCWLENWLWLSRIYIDLPILQVFFIAFPNLWWFHYGYAHCACRSVQEYRQNTSGSVTEAALDLPKNQQLAWQMGKWQPGIVEVLFFAMGNPVSWEICRDLL